MIQSYQINPGPPIPKVKFIPDEARFIIEGDSFMLRANDFYEPLMTELNLFLNAVPPSQVLDCYFYLDFYDTNSFKYLYQVFELLKSSKKQMVIHWKSNHQDPICIETAVLLQEDFPGLKFNFV